VTGDRRVDLMALDPTGALRLHPGLGGGRFGARVPVAAGWTAVTYVV
jgi:hypothetical protein